MSATDLAHNVDDDDDDDDDDDGLTKQMQKVLTTAKTVTISSLSS